MLCKDVLRPGQLRSPYDTLHPTFPVRRPVPLMLNRSKSTFPLTPFLIPTRLFVSRDSAFIKPRGCCMTQLYIALSEDDLRERS